ncbi:MAG: radical SAM protein [Deltaproteobacteria bacterium]|nr:radical SAM protein [Deltaproteobacteria bacterium]MBW2537240.1 radical SAM protein [Deltaproteobacteria bacterium]
MSTPGTGGEDRLLVAEVFRSIQGESTFAGLPCTFIRLAGCNLRCRWCDTPEAQQAPSDAQARSLDAVVAAALDGHTDLVLLTGGEPLLQAAAVPLLRALCDAGRTVLLETNGTMDVTGVDGRVHRIVDVKPPSSGCCAEERLARLSELGERDEVKFVLADREDYEWMRRVLAGPSIPPGPAVLASCVFGELDPKRLVEWVLADQLPVRVQLQLHKLIWGPDARGV